MQKIKVLISTLTTEKFNYIALWALVVPCSILSHTWLPFPPAILFFFVGLGAFLLANDPIINNHPEHKTVLPKAYQFILIGIGYMLFSQMFMGGTFSHIFGICAALSYFLLSVILVYKVKEKNVFKIVHGFIIVSVITLCLEAILRYTYSYYLITNGTNTLYGIYRFKFQGPMYLESNGLCIHLIVLLFFTLWWSEIQKKSYMGVKIILGLLIILSLSRAGWISTAIGLIYFYLLRGRSKKFWLTSGIFILLLFIFAIKFFIYPIIAKDPSFLSKFYIIEQSLNYFHHASLSNWLFGITLGHSEDLMGIYAHSYFLVFLIETGLIGFILITAIYLYFIWASKGSALIILIPFFIHTATTTNTFLPYLYVAMAIMIWWENKTKKIKDNHD